MLSALRQAASVVYRTLGPTPQRRWPLLDSRCGADVWIKHEHELPTGAFKVRGGLVYVDHLASQPHPPTGLVAATRGNHGQSVAFAARQYGTPVTIVVPPGNSVAKNRAMRALGADLVEAGHDFQSAFEAATEIAQARGWTMVPSFHELLVRGVASCSLELFEAVPALHTLYVPIGLGSGICGAVTARDALGLSTRIVGVVASAAPAYARSLEAGAPVSCEATTRIADGLACRVPSPEALEIIRRGVDRVIEVSDDEIEEAMRIVFDDMQLAAEGAAGAAFAAMLKECPANQCRTVGVVFTGSNVDRDVFARVINR